MAFFSSIEEAVQLTTRILADTAPKRVNAVYLYTQTPDNAHSVINRGAQMVLSHKTEYVVVLKNAEDMYGKKYTVDYDNQLSGRIARDRILSIDTGFAHTHTEAIAFIELAKRKGWKTVGVTAPPFHLLRAFAETVTIALKQYPHLSIFSIVGEPLPWTTHVVHSQNIVKGRRYELFTPELERLENIMRKEIW